MTMISSKNEKENFSAARSAFQLTNRSLHNTPARLQLHFIVEGSSEMRLPTTRACGRK
jgi:hypothetical protein